MMPNKPMTFRRWELIAMFVLPFAVAFLVTLYNSHQIAEAEDRIARNTVVNATQDEVRRQLVEHFKEVDMDTCRQIEELKAEFRQQARENFSRLAENARLLDIELTPELRARAAHDRDETLARFRAREC